ncbi:ferredoxin [Rubellimicrobium rubrum]|uniref:Ferredoxin n=1 Tax=Rubellimicrobium rubrum TaxID=2585369 RepID=A0A5C4MS45_9RHOB|nr:ferredoxin [Rubellimicrobium rubrum]TNC46595.1 ferredoxin [Rubellimicrobium rubrum]
MTAGGALLDEAAHASGLVVSGVAPLAPDDGLPDRFRSVALLSPDEPRFWPLFSESPEMQDGRPDALDRWSRRVIGRLACTMGTKAVFPFAGPPWRPFTDWARRSGRCWPSPVGLLVHDEAGLWISFRGAIALEGAAPSVMAPHPCGACVEKPCLGACPVRALTADRYDVQACHEELESAAGQTCLSLGCKVRRACPVGAYRRRPDQSAFHMKAFHPA